MNNMVFSRIDLDTEYLTKAEEWYKDDSIISATLKIDLPEGSALTLDENFIIPRFERMGKIKYDNAVVEQDFLSRVCGLKQDFIDFIYKTEYPEISYQERTFTLTGTKASIYLAYCALRNLITEHLYDNFLDMELIMEGDALSEGIRKLMVKFDMVRNSDFKFVESGSAVRYSYAWQATVYNAMVGDLKQNLIGTTNPLFALLYGTPLYFKKGTVVRPIIDSLKDGQEVDGSVYEMVHCYIHRGDRNTYLWSDLMSDVINLYFNIEFVV